MRAYSPAASGRTPGRKKLWLGFCCGERAVMAKWSA